MKIIQSQFTLKGYKHGNSYYIIKNEKGKYNVYQIFSDVNKGMVVNDIKNILPALKQLSDDEIIVSFPNEQHAGFLLLYNIDILQMNGFRITLDDEEVIS